MQFLSRLCFAWMLLFNTCLSAEPYFKLLQVWNLGGRDWRVIVVPRSSPDKVIEIARFIHKKYPKLAFYLVDTEQGITRFNSWARDREGKPFPMTWAKKHYFGVANEFIQRGGGMQWQISPAGAFASSYSPTSLD